MCEESKIEKIETVEPILEQPSVKSVITEPYSVQELSVSLQQWVEYFINSNRAVSFEVMINVFMNAYVAILFQFVKKSQVIPMIREHCEKIVDQIVAAKQNIDPEEYQPTEAKPSIILPTD